LNPGEAERRKLGEAEVAAVTRPWRLFTKNTGLCELDERKYRD
jgi:hypothetical protein